MRCSYCGGLNPDTASFCARCGKDILQRPSSVQSPSPQRPLPQQAQRPPYPQPLRPPQSVTSLQAPPPPQPVPAPRPVRVAQPRRQSQATPIAPLPTPQPPVDPPPDVQFPPHTVKQLRMLEPGALNYSVLDETVHNGRKRVIRIAFERCEPWRQIATLLKASDALRSSTYETLVLYGNITGNDDIYQYTNGMLQFDQKVRLGSQTVNRYQIETGTGWAADSLRIVLTE